MTENIKILALRLLDKFDEHISTQLLLLNYNRDRGTGPYFNGEGGPTGFSGLHGIAFLGIGRIVSTILEMKEWDINANDCMGMTALTRAAERGHEEVVNILLEREGINPDQADTEYGRTPLSWAAEGGHEGVVKMLLQQQDVDFSRADTFYRRTPLSWAAEGGHEGIVKLLLQQQDVSPDRAKTSYDQRPLSLAAKNGHEGVVKILLEREDINPDLVETSYGRIPLS